MADNTLNTNFFGGNKVQPSHIKQLATAINGQMVGRSGNVPTPGQSLGSLVIPWGTIFARSLNINGQRINLDATAMRENAVVSGKTLNNSGLPGFINIVPDNPLMPFNFKIDALETPLLITANGTDAEINRDIPLTMTPAPGVNNTPNTPLSLIHI